jgi:hypothetical protein
MRAAIKIALIAGKTGPLEAYAKQTIVGFQMGLEYATGGTTSVAGRKLVVIEKDDQTKLLPHEGGAKVAGEGFVLGPRASKGAVALKRLKAKSETLFEFGELAAKVLAVTLVRG